MKWLLVLAASYLGLSMIGGAFVADRALQRPRRPMTAADRMSADDLARTLGARLEAVAVGTRDGATLRGRLSRPPTRPACARRSPLGHPSAWKCRRNSRGSLVVAAG